VIQKISDSQLHATLIAAIVTITLVIFIKLKGSPKNLLQGGMPSGHAAVAFSLVTAAALLSENLLVTFIAFMLGLLVLQSRVEARIHSMIEVLLGAVLGVLLTVLVYKLFMI
jgi:diacylglycerol kinase (ATP)